MDEIGDIVGGGRHEDQGFKASPDLETLDSSLVTDTKKIPERITRADLEPRRINPGETEVVLQRHGAYVRDPEDPNIGSLQEGAIVDEEAAASAYFEKLLGEVPENERAGVCVLFVASDTQYRGGGKRSLETAIIAQRSARDVFKMNGVPETNILNAGGSLKGGDGPRPMARLREPQFFDKSPDFFNFLLEKYGGMNLDFWIAFEEDRHKETRLAMGAEGPDDIVDRTSFAVRVFARYAKAWHQANPGKRLIIWADTHYDTISPFVKREMLGVGKEVALPVDYGAGITIKIDTEGKSGSTCIGGQEYEVSLTRPVKKDEEQHPEQSQI